MVQRAISFVFTNYANLKHPERCIQWSHDMSKCLVWWDTDTFWLANLIELRETWRSTCGIAKRKMRFAMTAYRFSFLWIQCHIYTYGSFENILTISLHFLSDYHWILNNRSVFIVIHNAILFLKLTILLLELVD